MRRLAFIAATLVLAACGEGINLPTAPFDPNAPDPAATLTRVQNEIFTPTCALAGCHDPGLAQAGLILIQGQAWTHLVNRPSSEIPQILRVAPGSPDTSYLYWKITGRSGIIGAPMPFGGPPLSQAHQNLIRDWIRRGAPND